MKLRLWVRLIRWVVLHLFFSAVPIISSWMIFRFFLDRAWELHAGEVLFFAFMISSIACGEVVELMIQEGATPFRLVLAVGFLIGALWSALLYALNLYDNTMSRGHGEKVLWHSIALACVFFVFGTVVQVIFLQLEHLTKENGGVVAEGATQ